MSEYWKACSNCEGEGRVVIWTHDAVELPFSAVQRWPKDYPHGDFDKITPSYACPYCKGHGQRKVY